MKKFKRLPLLFTLGVTLTSCSFGPEEPWVEPITDDSIFASRIVESTNKNYLEVDGLPFNYNGVQIRTDWLMSEQGESLEEMEYYFEKAANLNVKCVEIPLRWKDIEPRQDAYDFRMVSTFLRYAKKYNLRIEFLLFGVNIGGMTGTAPDYVKSNKEVYSRYEDNTHHPDAIFFKQDDPDTIGREKACASALMDAIYTWSKQNEYNAVIAIQVRNEPDIFLHRLDEYAITKDNGKRLSYDEAYEENLFAIKEMGKTIKEAKYKCITRVNICNFPRHEDRNVLMWSDILKTGTIDIVGEDTYRPGISYNKNIIDLMNFTTVPNYKTLPQIAENTGNYENGNSLFLMANMLGAGYNLYDMITPSVITDSWGYTDWGILDNKTKQPKAAYEPIKNILKGINDAGALFPIVKSEDIACFNLTSDYPKTSLSQIVSTSKSRFNFSTTNNALAFAINYNDYIYVYSDKPCTITIDQTTLDNQSLEIGVMDNALNFTSTNEQCSMSENTINLAGMKLYRVKALETSSLGSNTKDNIYSEA